MPAPRPAAFPPLPSLPDKDITLQDIPGLEGLGGVLEGLVFQELLHQILARIDLLFPLDIGLRQERFRLDMHQRCARTRYSPARSRFNDFSSSTYSRYCLVIRAIGIS